MPHEGHGSGIDCDGWYGLFRLRLGLACILGGKRISFFELLRMTSQRHALNDACVLRTPCFKMPNLPEPPMNPSLLGTAVASPALPPPLWPRRHGCTAALIPAWALHRVARCQANPVIRFSWAPTNSAGVVSVRIHLLRIAQIRV